MSARVVSLVPSATETLVAWGIEPVAVTRFCEMGERYPTVGGTKNPEIDGIVALRPDLVVVCDQENRVEDADALSRAGCLVHVLHITSVDHVAPSMRALALALGIDPEMGESCAPPAMVPIADAPVPVYVPIWKRPWMTINGDTYGGSLLRSLGCVGIADGDGDRYPEIAPEEAKRRGASLVIAPDEPYVFSERHRPELSGVAPVLFVDGKDLFWWGVRTPSAVRRLHGVLTKALADALDGPLDGDAELPTPSRSSSDG